MEGENQSLDSKEARGQRLRQLRALTASATYKQLSRAVIERKYGLSASTLRHWEEAYGVGLTEEGAKQVVGIYQQENIHCTISWLMQGVGSPPKRRRTTEPLLSAGVSQAYLTTMKQERDYFKVLHPEGITLEVGDDAMEPWYQAGDLVGGIRHYHNAFLDLIGKDCIIETKSGEMYVRRLQKSTVPGQYNLYALNPDTKVEHPHLYAMEVLVCAPVVRIWRGGKW